MRYLAMFTTAVLVLTLFGVGFYAGYTMAIDIFSLECFKTGI